MTVHYYGDDSFDWEGLDWCINYLDKNLRRFGRINVRQAKEKYGSARIYCSLGWDSLLNITHPGYCHYRPYPKWLRILDIFYLSKVIPYLNYIVLPYHKFLYRKLYKDCVIKYPHLKHEILDYADYHELLKNL
jgi:hypothetical protein